MNKVLVGTVALAAVALANPAFAADLPAQVYKAPVVAPVIQYSWTGCYIGAEGGGAWGRASNTSFDPVQPGVITGNYNLSGWLVGGTLGCNYQVDHIVFGVEVDASWTNKRGSTFALAPFTTSSSIQTRENWIGTARGRLGYAFDRWLVYVTGGAAATRASDNISDAVFGVSATDAQNRLGWTAGGGLEVAVDRNWSFKAEYLYADFGSRNYFVPDVAVPVGGGRTFTFLSQSVRLTDQIIRVGVNYRFGWDAPVVSKY